MRITENLLRQIIREELSRVTILNEVVKNIHGYTVRAPGDVIWGGDKMRIPKQDNPFVGGSAAFEDWYNDGTQSVRFTGVRNAGTPYEEEYAGRSYVYIREDDWVLIPTIWDQTPGIAQIFAIEHKSAANVPGAGPTDTIPVARLRFATAAGNTMVDVGLAFLARLGSDKTIDGETGVERAQRKANDFMKFHKSGVEAREERAERRAEREMKRAEREQQKMASLAPPPAPAARPAAALRRPGGVAPPPAPRKPIEMSGDEVRDFLGIRRRE